ncbi:hypothetical protein GUITHDRAFT_80592 [Guillardia theta CCMP2712]|uniref:(S)-ureidoglycine aminohydrolase cupin domain-containing protein n=1 Tax=Guillardia theta (strain CCMP2712) TaxID=905079 RepID=L1IDM4_GUITC|nr:hypothetical protein GUITHDRAFT_80592 [Guillardia theta CCMP2712]EKX34356.1 hypothetical protein GUITHDRAFT_80592 [Guillardia theta CCMP2712]|eukprot:XP_005821336.1 hypothetical protein GUITHDRAFT_80592 [Guillardia theta CCMP2712]
MSEIQVVEAPGADEIAEAKKWPTWDCEPSKFPWSYSQTETCYVLEGHVTVTPDGSQPVEIKAGQMATFPKGMKCTWEVHTYIKKHYNFE